MVLDLEELHHSLAEVYFELILSNNYTLAMYCNTFVRRVRPICAVVGRSNQFSREFLLERNDSC